MPKPAITLIIPGKPRSKENKGMFNRKSYYFKKYPELMEWEENVNSLAIEEMKKNSYPGPYKGRCIVVAEFTFDSWGRRDITNFWKSLNDALNGAIWVDDSQVDATIQVRKINRRDPRIIVHIYFLDISFDEEYPKKKYPDEYNIIKIKNLSIKSEVDFLQEADDIKPRRFGKFITFRETKDELKSKRKPRTKIDNRRRVNINGIKAKAKEEKAKAARGKQRAKRASATRTRRRRASSS